MKLLNLKNPFNAPVYHEETLSSTFDAARILAAKNAAHGTVIAADFQEAGRGRGGRSWAAERGKSLLFTILLHYDDIPSIPAALTLKTGLAVSLAVEDLIPAIAGSVKVKWPNDIIVCPDKTQTAYKAQAAFKAAGILTETDGKTVYIGAGVNVAQTEFPQDVRGKAGSLIQAFPALGDDARFILLEKILTRLHEEIELPRQAENWRVRLERRLYKKGEAVTFAPGAADTDCLIEGTLSGISAAGELLIIPRGAAAPRAFASGELRVY